MTDRAPDLELAGADLEEKPNDVILAITRAQHEALRWCSSIWRQRRGTYPGTRVCDSLRSKALAKSHYRRYGLDRYNLTPAGRAVLRALELLHPTKPKKRAS